MRNLAHGGEEGGVYFVVALGGEAGTEEVEGVCGCGGEAAGEGTGDERFGWLGEWVR